MSQSSSPTAESTRSTPLLRLGWIMVLIPVLLIAGYFLMPASVHYRLFHDEQSFNQVMSRQVSPGTQMEQVQQLLGAGNKLTGEELDRIRRATVNFGRQWPDAYPDGTDDDDQFFEYEVGSYRTHLQFRAGVLINFDPADYSKPFEFSGISP